MMIYKKLKARVSQIFWDIFTKITNDPTFLPPPSYDSRRSANRVYKYAFDRCFDFLYMNKIYGDIVEFGTFNGYTARLLAGNIKKYNWGRSLFLFDSFEGLPEIVSKVDQACYEVKDQKVWCKGAISTSKGTEKYIFRSIQSIIPDRKTNVIKGFFSDTLKADVFDDKLALVHIDCDLYQSTFDVLRNLVDWRLLQDGTILMFDDYNCSRGNPAMGERKAIADVFNDKSRYSLSPYINYGWHGAAFIVHEIESKL